MTYAWDNDSTQNAHIKQMRDDRQKAYMETHRDNKAYERFKHMPDYGKGAVMERSTSNKKVSDMSMIELAHNSCYADDERNARYRDYEMDMDARDFARNLMVTLTKDELPISDTEFDVEILDDLAIDPFSDVRGLIALFYRNLWAMANLRETLKKYEDLEERGRLIKLPVKDDTTGYRECVHTKSQCHHEDYKCSECPLTELFCDEFYKAIDRCYEEAYASGCLAGMELGKSEAKAKK